MTSYQFIFTLETDGSRSCPIKSLNYGNVIYEGNNTSSLARYTCNVGLVLQGSGVRQCLSTGDWGGIQPICKRK